LRSRHFKLKIFLRPHDSRPAGNRQGAKSLEKSLENRPLARQHAFVTGGGRGIGRAVAAALTHAGATVTVMGRSEAPLRSAVEAGDAAACGVGDVTDVVEVKRAVASAEAARGPIAILVNNAGSVESGPFIKADPAVFLAMWNVHLMGAVYAGQAVLPGMIARGTGRIINVASTAGLKGYPYVAAYCAAKHALVGLTRALAAETATRGVTVNAVCPGYTDTELVRDSLDRVASKTGRAHADVLADYVADTPIGRLIKPEEVAAAVLYLCSPEAAAITGTTLAIAGGEL
jgi:3-hydroxybutyrate dehydrogenase